MKQNRREKFWSLLLATVLLFSAFQATVFADNELEEEQCNCKALCSSQETSYEKSTLN